MSSPRRHNDDHKLPVKSDRDAIRPRLRSPQQRSNRLHGDRDRMNDQSEPSTTQTRQHIDRNAQTKRRNRSGSRESYRRDSGSLLPGNERRVGDRQGETSRSSRQETPPRQRQSSVCEDDGSRHGNLRRTMREPFSGTDRDDKRYPSGQSTYTTRNSRHPEVAEHDERSRNGDNHRRSTDYRASDNRRRRSRSRESEAKSSRYSTRDLIDRGYDAPRRDAHTRDSDRQHNTNKALMSDDSRRSAQRESAVDGREDRTSYRSSHHRSRSPIVRTSTYRSGNEPDHSRSSWARSPSRERNYASHEHNSRLTQGSSYASRGYSNGTTKHRPRSPDYSPREQRLKERRRSSRDTDRFASPPPRRARNGRSRSRTPSPDSWRLAGERYRSKQDTTNLSAKQSSTRQPLYRASDNAPTSRGRARSRSLSRDRERRRHISQSSRSHERIPRSAAGTRPQERSSGGDTRSHDTEIQTNEELDPSPNVHRKYSRDSQPGGAAPDRRREEAVQRRPTGPNDRHGHSVDTLENVRRSADTSVAKDTRIGKETSSSTKTSYLDDSSSGIRYGRGEQRSTLGDRGTYKSTSPIGFKLAARSATVRKPSVILMDAESLETPSSRGSTSKRLHTDERSASPSKRPKVLQKSNETRQSNGSSHSSQKTFEQTSQAAAETSEKSVKLGPKVGDAASLTPGKFPVDGSIYERIGQVGEGTYGKVYKARHRQTDELVALKRIRMEQERDGFPITSMREIKLLQRLKHPGIVTLLEMMIERSSVYMVFEYMDHDLTGVLANPNITFENAHIKDLAVQLFEGLAYLHHRGVLHRDIKGSNILLNNAGQLKLADFGLARYYQKSQTNADYTNRVITLWFRPPELLLGATAYDAAVDIWSAGCILIELFTKATIFPGRDEIHQLETIYQVLGTPTPEDWPGIAQLPWFELIKFKHFESKFEESYRDLLTPAALDLGKQILRLDPLKRPLATEILQHDFFTTEEPKAVRRALYDISESHEWDTKQRRRDERVKKLRDEKEKGNAEVAGVKQ